MTDPVRTRFLLVGAVLAVLGVAGLSWLVLPDDPARPPAIAQRHVEEACTLTVRAARMVEDDVEVELPVRYATAALVLDRAVDASRRATEVGGAGVTVDVPADVAELDRAVRALHAAAHAGAEGPWNAALVRTRAACS